MFLKTKTFRMILIAVFVITCGVSLAFSAEKVEKYIPDTASAEEGMTLWEVIVSGGEVMVILALLSIAAVSLIIFYFLTIKQEKLFPEDFMERSLTLIEEKKYDEAKTICEGEDNMLSGILKAGLIRRGREKGIIKEAMQDEGRRNIDNLWQRLSYLSDIAVISPMVGLLGTVLGMIQAFNVIAFQTGAVKPILLASGISKAMVTTATGLIIAIPAMIFYAYFRGKVQALSARLEDFSNELFHLMTV